MNKIYFADSGNSNYGGVYISAPNLKEAKEIARMCDQVADHLKNFLDLRCHAIYNSDKKSKYKIKRTEIPSRELTIKEILEHKLNWFACDKCDDDRDLKYIKLSNEYYGTVDGYECLKCGNKSEIPYMD